MTIHVPPRTRPPSVRPACALKTDLATPSPDRPAPAPASSAPALTAPSTPALRAAHLLLPPHTAPRPYPALLAGSFDDGGKIARVLFAIRAAETTAASGWRMEQWQPAQLDGAKLTGADLDVLLHAVPRLGTTDELRHVFDVALAATTPPAQRPAPTRHDNQPSNMAKAQTGNAGWREGQGRPPAPSSRLGTLMSRVPLVSMADTRPDFSICSNSRAARL